MAKHQRPHRRRSKLGKPFKAGQGTSRGFEKGGWENLLEGDVFAEKIVRDMINHGMTPNEALKIYVNSVEGDTSQLPNRLVGYARAAGWLSKEAGTYPTNTELFFSPRERYGR